MGVAIFTGFARFVRPRSRIYEERAKAEAYAAYKQVKAEAKLARRQQARSHVLTLKEIRRARAINRREKLVLRK